MKRHSDPNDVSLVRWSEWRFAGSILRAYSQGSKQTKIKRWLLNFMFEYVVWIWHVRELYIPPNVCNCRCVDASSVAYTDFRIFTCESRSSSGSPQSVHLSVRRYATPLGCLVCVRSVTPKVFVRFYSNFAQWLFTHWRCALTFCAHFMNIFSFLRGVELRHFSDKKCLDGVWVV